MKSSTHANLILRSCYSSKIFRHCGDQLNSSSVIYLR